MVWIKQGKEKQMGETVIEKIIRNNVGKSVRPGDIVTVNVDRVMIHDIFIPFVAEKFEEMGFTKLWDPEKVILIYDHLVPASQPPFLLCRQYGKNPYHKIVYGLFTSALEIFSLGKACSSSFFIASIKTYSVP